MGRLSPLTLPQAKALMNDQSARMVPMVQQTGVFSPEECERIISLRDQLGVDQARIESRSQQAGRSLKRDVDRSVRDTERTHLMHSPTTDWIYQRLSDAVTQANTQAWNFRLAFMEPPQLLGYPVGGHYGWHADIGASGLMALRKVSVTIQLSPSEDYVGGELEIQSGGRVLKPHRPRGSAVLFPSYQPHRVAPVTRGKRYSIVLWVVGKRPLR
ncbi:MAG: 2OG-Fe(II) oxygenase [Myxococcota bacterium]